jgi:hypothetical protein
MKNGDGDSRREGDNPAGDVDLLQFQDLQSSQQQGHHVTAALAAGGSVWAGERAVTLTVTPLI